MMNGFEYKPLPIWVHVVVVAVAFSVLAGIAAWEVYELGAERGGALVFVECLAVWVAWKMSQERPR